MAKITPEAYLKAVCSDGASDKATASVIAAAALHIREGLDNLAKETRLLRTSRYE